MAVTTTIPIVLNGDVGEELAIRQAQNYCLAHNLILVAYTVRKNESPNQTVVDAVVTTQ